MSARIVYRGARGFASEQVEGEGERAECGDASGGGDERLLRLATPADELDQQQAQPAREMRCQREDEGDLARCDPGRAGPGEESIERGGAAESLRESEEMQRQEQ